MMRVSVVVPVYNPGSSLHRCVESLLAQSLPTDAMELIFVNDGSTDGSGDHLDEIASQHPHMRVIHEPNSGWAGRPRNVGVDAASGEFVQFVDQDDMLGPEALERLIKYGAEHDADIVIGKVTSDFRRVPHELFRRNLPRCSIHDTQLIRSLTPHKMFRRQFLIDNNIRFAEGRRRLEDQLFMAQAYFATDKVAILADYPCYFYLRRADGGNAGKATWEAADYYGYVREVLDVVAANTDAGEWRDALHERFLNAMLQKVTAAAAVPDGDKRLLAMMTEVSAVVGEYFSPQVAARPPILRRQLTAAILSGRPKKVHAAILRYRRPAGTIQSFVVNSAEPGGWTISARASLRFRDGERVRFHAAGDRWRVDPRLRVKNLHVGTDSADDLRTRTSADVVLRSATTGVEWIGATSLAASFEPVRAGAKAHHLQLTGSVDLDPASFAAGAPLPAGTWEVYLRLTGLGISRDVAIQRSDFTTPPSRKVRRHHPNARLRITRRDDLAVIVPVP